MEQALTLERGFLSVPDAGLYLAFVESHQMQVVWVAPPVDSASSIRFIRYMAPNTNW
jgi:hypothetical protein